MDRVFEYLFTQTRCATKMYFICIECVCVVRCVVLGVCVYMSFLPESWSCFPGHPQGVPQDSSCRPSGTSPEHEPSPMNGSPGPPPPQAYAIHTHAHKHTPPQKHLPYLVCFQQTASCKVKHANNIQLTSC